MIGMRTGKLGPVSTGTLKMTGIRFAPRQKAVFEVKKITTDSLEMMGVRLLKIGRKSSFPLVPGINEIREAESLPEGSPAPPARPRMSEEGTSDTDIR